MLGSAVRHLLAVRHAATIQLVRRETAGAGELKWDPSAAPPIADLGRLDGITAAVHLSGASVAGKRWSAAYKREIEASRIESTRALATALAGMSKPPKTLLVASAGGIYGSRGDEILDEKSSPGKGFLADVCRHWEAAARPAIEAGIRVVHLRFGVVLGHEGALGKMLPAFRLGLGGRLGSGQQWMSWIGLADAAAAVLFAMDTPMLAGPVNVTAPVPVTNAEFTRSLAKAVHRPAVLPAPAFALRLAFGEMADETLLASQRMVPAKLLAAGFRFAEPTVDAALEAVIRA